MKKKLTRKKKAILWVLLVFTTILLAVSLSAYFYMMSMLNLINRGDDLATVSPEDEFFETNDENGSGEEMDPEDVIWPEDDNGVIRDKDIINILLIGQDRRPGEGRARSDSMMIATLNRKNGSIKITSLMRDMYVNSGYRTTGHAMFRRHEASNEVIAKTS